MSDNTDLSHLAPGSTIILSTTSADKKLEYMEIFSRYDVNFFTLEDFGLAPQKTDEMTGSYANNLLQKGFELARALGEHYGAIKGRLRLRGIDTSQIVGMVEDSGIEILPADKRLRELFRQRFHDLLWERILTDFESNESLRKQAFPHMHDADIAIQMDMLFDTITWLFEIDQSSRLPGPNFKPIMEHLHGGFIEIFDLMYQALVDVSPPQERPFVNTERRLRYRNHCSAILVSPHQGHSSTLDYESIVYGDNKGFLVSWNEFRDAVAARIEGRLPRHQTGEIYTSHIILPDDQLASDSVHDRQTLIEEYGLLKSNHKDIARDYRLKLARNLALRHQLPAYEDAKTAKRWHNPAPLRVMLLYPGATLPAYATILQEKLSMLERVRLLPMVPYTTLVEAPTERLMHGADLVLILPDEMASPLEHGRLLLAAMVDKQVMPSAKEKVLSLCHVEATNHSPYRESLHMLRHLQLNGLKNGLSELNDVLTLEGFDGTAIWQQFEPIITRELTLKARRLTEVEAITSRADTPVQILTPLPDPSQSVFVAGGAANDYPLFKQAANQLGRYLYMNGHVLVTGAGAKDGPMGAVHSGFVEAYLLNCFQPRRKTEHGKLGLRPAERELIETGIDKLIAGILAERKLIGKDAAQFRSTIRKAVFEQPDAHLLGVHAPHILEKLLSPSPHSKRYELLGSLLESGRMIGYSMPPLLISEGSGKPPPGMVYQHAGNMMRRMVEMTKAHTHIYLAGGQGTKQELVESCLLSIAHVTAGKPPVRIFILNQPVYNGESLYDHTLSFIESHLRAQHPSVTTTDIGIRTCSTIAELEALL